ncbi:hypothetical protein OIU84_007208 [Salix udensis]|uniref:Uncharacterized protein n=1 Tax=Salix udensis TaxID=889485 RepID=A0AAD6NZ87_9ROSI|nr:hypothetical protein OIU84_007208 [Salix udensis]
MTASLSFMVEAGEKGNAKKHQGRSSQCLFQSVLPTPAIKLIVRCRSAAHPLQSTASGGAVFLKFTNFSGSDSPLLFFTNVDFSVGSVLLYRCCFLRRGLPRSFGSGSLACLQRGIVIEK